MNAIEVALVLGSLLSVGALWAVPRAMAQNASAAITAGVLALVAPAAALWLLGSVAVIPLLMRLGELAGRRGAVVIFCSALLATLLIASREIEGVAGQPIALVGGAYFTLRHVHVLMEWWLGRLSIPSIAAYARYHLFLPVLMVGPIHRLPHFERQCARRRWSADEFFSGAERALFGLALAVVVGGYLHARLIDLLKAHELFALSPFLESWIFSALDWVRIYITFSGFTDLALGLSLMMGLRLEENFDRPWRARNLIEFWTRWHMTLSHWCRDYVYVPIAASFRAPVIGVFAAMLVLGLWHETSAYYILWAFWQALGIVLTQLYLNREDPLRLQRLPALAKSVFGPLAVLIWLSGARPVLETALEVLIP
ncbi:MBOAT family O-acyltransferase [Pelagibius sp. Alg239-R121]|uniref:MBOAT family O-acyltransferase n=1 Tax=Pelagibius sp. Alg239-R121 TaxID=2993448 RepID=UPI0024A753B1|nr:MBOAT family O-acyltransferase [Pelagibius sp. Alg239-R121]